MNKVFANSSKLWNWLVVSSADPTQVALTVKGWVATIIPAAMLVIHNPNLSDLPNDVYSFIMAALVVVSALVTLWGFVRKIVNTVTSGNSPSQQ